MPYTLTISVDSKSNSIVITDGNGDPGGNVIANTGDVITWINTTDLKCMLRFQELRLGRQPGYGPRVWPFRAADPGGDLEIPSKGNGGGTIEGGKLSGGKAAFYVKYDVRLPGVGVPPPLDPMIIIER